MRPLLADGDRFGVSAARLGDLDGAGDVLFGSRLADAGGSTRGAARVLFTGYAVATEPGRLAGALGAPYPNPVASGAVTLPFVLAEAGAVRLVTVLGREITVLTDDERPAGAHTVRFDAGRLIPGAYVVRAELSGQAATRTLVVAR